MLESKQIKKTKVEVMAHRTGLFPLSYLISDENPGGPVFKVELIVYTPKERVVGFGSITQPLAGLQTIDTEMKGNYTFMKVSTDSSYIIIAVHGYPPVMGPSISLGNNIQLPNCDLRMIVSDDWKSGTANYKYLDSEGIWHDIKDIPVNLVANPSKLKK
jgi:hypothetical protein